MARLDNVQRILPEDFSEEDRQTVTQLASVLNYFMTQTVDIVNGRIDYDNINKQLVTFEVIVDANGSPIQTLNFSAEAGVLGGNVLNAQNLTNTAVFPLSQPFVSFTPSQQSGIYRVNNISGLQPNNKYRITYEVTY